MAAPGILSTCSKLHSRFLDGLAPRDLERILAAAKHRRYLANSVIVNQGNPADHLFLLTKGRARFFLITPEGQKIILHWLIPGEILGGAALLHKSSVYFVSTEAVKETSILAWDRATIRGLVARYPVLLENTLFTASEYLAWYVAAHVALISQSARQRLAHVLVSLAQSIGVNVPGGVEIDVTNEELASTANITPFTASHLLSEWQSNRAVEKRRGKVLLRSPERLFLHVV
ncbi:MAG TPA: Crp/Fnr family transcriptional regulator [Candidatus Acidoferrales bacterium]|nr:Crp/Fnr family transcriptional regulator [Candidatus Acidoferrales bacterium]